MSEPIKVAMQDVAKAVEAKLPKGTAFVVLAFGPDPDGETRAHYVSNGKREDIWRAVCEWALKTDHRPMGAN